MRTTSGSGLNIATSGCLKKTMTAVRAAEMTAPTARADR